MNLIPSTRFLAAAVLAAAALGAATAAQARSDVYFSVGVQGPPAVYVQPAPVYVQPQAYPAPYGYSYEDERAWRHAEWRRQQYWRHHRHHGWQEQQRGRHWD
ncbi:MAG: hypothetical protein HYX47_01570 [Burkholderiales bacterium]|nr:hypothetical protein [Burkholderiales bacterium]